MASLLKSTKNTRAILPENFKYIRSDVPDRLTEKEIEWLICNKITTVIDLREAKEREQKRCPLSEDVRFTYLCMPITGGSDVPKTPDDVSRSYSRMMDEKMQEVIETLERAETNVLYFCNAGKDRTGVVSAILLTRLGMDKAYIIEDYLKSAENLKEMLEAYVKAFPEVDIQVIMPQKRYMEEFLNWYEEMLQ